MRLPVVIRSYGVSFCPSGEYNRQLFFTEHLQYTGNRCFYHNFVLGASARKNPKRFYFSYILPRLCEIKTEIVRRPCHLIISSIYVLLNP